MGADLCLPTLTVCTSSRVVLWVPRVPTLTLVLVSTATSTTR